MLTFQEVKKLSEAYSLIFGRNHLQISLAGLEPLLWKDDSVRIYDLIRELANFGFSVDITTNGYLLKKMSVMLARSGLRKCRVSVHSFDRELYRRITGSDYLNEILKEIDHCLDMGIDININRTLLNGFIDDIPKGINFINKRNIKAKFYDLLWVPQISEVWQGFYIHWKCVIDKYVVDLTKEIECIEIMHHRSRLRYHLIGGGAIEVKLFNENMHTSLQHCIDCPQRDFCKETFGEYIYFFPNKHIAFCNLNEKICLDLSMILKGTVEDIAEFLIKSFTIFMGINWKEILGTGRLQLYLNEVCNYKCSFPGDCNEQWCLSYKRFNKHFLFNQK